jgi:type I restriction enzyme S subunit
MKAYEAYRESGVEWIGTIPKQWSAKRLSFLFRVIGSGTTPPTDDGAYYDGELPWVTTGELREAGISDTAKKLTYDALTAFPTLRMYPPGTLLIAMYGATIGRLGWLSVSACTNQACCALAAPQGVIPRFAFFALLAANEALILLASGGGQPNINQEKIRAFRLPMPSLIEQEAIAAFLDQETGKIDALVAEQERLIALLKEKRQAVISQAVTKGLNPNAPMKDSGIEWLGQVPAHWELGRLKQFGALQGGSGFPPELQGLEGEEFPFYKVGDLGASEDGMRMGGGSHSISRKTADELRAKIIPIGSILYAKIGAALLINRRRITTVECCIDNNLSGYIPNQAWLRSDWAFYWLSIIDFGKVVNPGAVPSFSEGDQSILPISVPPLREQDELIDYLAAETRKLDTLITEATQAITLLRERRAALISAAVTGKIDVRSLAPTKQEAA